MKQLIYRLTEPAETIPEERKIFSNHDLKGLILPLFLEQLLEVLVGVADTFMVSYAGEAAVSGVSLVNMFNTVFIFLFSALASGGAVVVSQYIGSRNRKNGNLSAGQLVMISAVFSAAAMILSLIFNRQLLRLLFGEVDQDVMTACVTYLRISAYSYPAIAVYNAGAAVCRSIGKTNVTMNISLVANGINIAGNAIGVFVFHAGVAGVAYPSLIARSFSAVVILIICFRQQEQVRLQWKNIFRWEGQMVKRILGIAVPNGIENGLILLITPLVLRGYALSVEAAHLVVILVVIHNIFNALFYPFSGALANGLRAAGDVKFTMYVSIFSTIGCRVVFSILLGILLNMGVIGIALAMCLDWMIRALFFWVRFRSGKWKEFRVIG